ncbi:4Fe-4S binding protein [uncultured Methanobrevibacter sp.]|nr:4Fe-4S binding protein [uncultured Methanobrevibacter sp.]
MNCQPSEAPCIKICEHDAFKVLGGAITLDYDKCTKCRDCVEVCPIGIISIQ